MNIQVIKGSHTVYRKGRNQNSLEYIRMPKIQNNVHFFATKCDFIPES